LDDATQELFNQGRRALDRKQYEDAISYFTRAIEKKPNYLEAYFYRGTAKSNLKDYKGAIADYDKVIELDPNHADAY
jgi:tetratricopeptide (TPR) repeat protein